MFIIDMLRLSRIALFLCAVLSLAAAERPASVAQGRAALARLPLRFEANQGQFLSEVRYAARTGGLNLLLTNHGPKLAVAGAQPVAITLLNSNPAPAITPLEPLSARTDYFIGHRENWHTGVRSYAKVRYGGVYPGVDVIYYGSQGQLEYDFVLRPGADPRAIRLKFSGASHVALTPEGDVSFETAGGRVVQKRPVIYQQDPATAARQEVSGRYVLLAKGVVGLRLDHYDRARTLVVDPVLVYSTYMGGSNTDRINAVRLDANGLLYLAGQTNTNGASTSFTGDLAAIGNYFQPNGNGITDAFLAIIDTTGANGDYGLIYFSYLGGSGIDVANGLQLDQQGNVYLVGTTSSTDFPIAGNALQTTGAATTSSAFVAVISPDIAGTGGLLYSTYLGGTEGNSVGNGIDLDSAGNVYVIGNTKAGDFPVTPSAYAGVIFGPQDAFLCEFSTNSANLLYSTFLGGELDDWGIAIIVNRTNGLVYFAANTVSTEFPLGPNSYQINLKGPADAVIGIMDFTQSGTASLVYDTYFGGSDNDAVEAIQLDVNGNLLVTGYTLSNDFPVTGNALQVRNAGNGDAFVSVVNPLNPSAFVIYSTYLGGSDGEVAYGIAGDPAGNIYVTGYTLSSDFPVTSDTVQPWGSGVEVFVAIFKPGVRPVTYATYLGGATVNAPTGMVVGPDGRVYVVGWTTGDLLLTPNAYQIFFGGCDPSTEITPVHCGYSDGFVVVLK